MARLIFSNQNLKLLSHDLRSGCILGDLHRLVRQYNRQPNAIWPTGAYFKGGTYGTDMNITPAIAERNNPTWKACTNRDA